MEIAVKDLDDFNGTVDELIEILKKIRVNHGKKTRIRVDAGYNNVEFLITTNKYG